MSLSLVENTSEIFLVFSNDIISSKIAKKKTLVDLLLFEKLFSQTLLVLMTR